MNEFVKYKKSLSKSNSAGRKLKVSYFHSQLSYQPSLKLPSLNRSPA